MSECHRVGDTTRRRRKRTRKEFTSTLLSNSITTKKSSESEFSFTLILVRQRCSQTRSSRQLVLSPTDPWLRSRPPTRPYPSQGQISVQPRDALATANLCYRLGLAVARASRGCTLIGPWLRYGLVGGRDLSHGSVGDSTSCRDDLV